MFSHVRALIEQRSGSPRYPGNTPGLLVSVHTKVDMILETRRGVRAAAERLQRGETRSGRATPTRPQAAAAGTFTTKPGGARGRSRRRARRQAWIAPEVSGQTFDRYVDSMFWPHRVPRLPRPAWPMTSRCFACICGPLRASRQMERPSVPFGDQASGDRGCVRRAAGSDSEGAHVPRDVLNRLSRTGAVRREPCPRGNRLHPSSSAVQVQGDLSLRVRRVSS